jgi:hypothetical protein
MGKLIENLVFLPERPARRGRMDSAQRVHYNDQRELQSKLAA